MHDAAIHDKPAWAQDRKRWHFASGQYDSALRLVFKHHYSRRRPHAWQVIGTFHEDGGLFGDFGEAVAACILSITTTPWKEDVIELSRLVRNDSKIPLTPLIAKTLRLAKSKGFDLVISYADATQGHHGGIYQAASWSYNGQRTKMLDGFIINGIRVPKRTARANWGTVSVDDLSKRFDSVIPTYDEGKHLYWKALNKEGSRKAERLGLKSLPYPKPDREAKPV